MLIPPLGAQAHLPKQYISDRAKRTQRLGQVSICMCVYFRVNDSFLLAFVHSRMSFLCGREKPLHTISMCALGWGKKKIVVREVWMKTKVCCGAESLLSASDYRRKKKAVDGRKKRARDERDRGPWVRRLRSRNVALDLQYVLSMKGRGRTLLFFISLHLPEGCLCSFKKLDSISPVPAY